jgi:hypothetical protein
MPALQALLLWRASPERPRLGREPALPPLVVSLELELALAPRLSQKPRSLAEHSRASPAQARERSG